MNPKDEPSTTTDSEPEKKQTTIVRCENCSGRGFTVWGDQNIPCGACDGTGEVEK